MQSNPQRTTIAFAVLQFCTVICLMILLPFYAGAQQTGDPAAIKKKIGEVRKATNWDNPSEVQKAKATIDSLSKLLTKTMKQQNIPANETPEEKSIREENDTYQQQLTDEVLESAQKGKGADLLLGKPTELQIDKFISDEEEKRKKKSPEYYDQMNFLCLDMSSPEVQTIIDQMDKFKNITTMVVMGGTHQAPVDLNLIFSKAAQYPLQELYIIDFPLYIKEFPADITRYSNLTLLSLANNSISSIPEVIQSLKKLTILYIDLNPINTIIGRISGMKQLEKLGIEKTNISTTEKAAIRNQLPNCYLATP